MSDSDAPGHSPDPAAHQPGPMYMHVPELVAAVADMVARRDLRLPYGFVFELRPVAKPEAVMHRLGLLVRPGPVDQPAPATPEPVGKVVLDNGAKVEMFRCASCGGEFERRKPTGRRPVRCTTCVPLHLRQQQRMRYAARVP